MNRGDAMATLTLAEIDAWWHNAMLARDGVPWRERPAATSDLVGSAFRKLFPANRRQAREIKVEGHGQPFSFEDTVMLLINGPGWLEDPPVHRLGRLRLMP